MALVRRCNRCSRPFLKESGCNKMRCDKCGNTQCYVCSQDVVDYTHFDKKTGCPMYGDMADLLTVQVESAQKDAVEAVLKVNGELKVEDVEVYKEVKEVIPNGKKRKRPMVRRAQRRNNQHLTQEPFQPPPVMFTFVNSVCYIFFRWLIARILDPQMSIKPLKPQRHCSPLTPHTRLSKKTLSLRLSLSSEISLYKRGRLPNHSILYTKHISRKIIIIQFRRINLVPKCHPCIRSTIFRIILLRSKLSPSQPLGASIFPRKPPCGRSTNMCPPCLPSLLNPYRNRSRIISIRMVRARRLSQGNCRSRLHNCHHYCLPCPCYRHSSNSRTISSHSHLPLHHRSSPNRRCLIAAKPNHSLCKTNSG